MCELLSTGKYDHRLHFYELTRMLLEFIRQKYSLNLIKNDQIFEFILSNVIVTILLLDGDLTVERRH